MQKPPRTPKEISFQTEKKAITLSLNKILFEKLKIHAEIQKLPVSVLIDEAIAAYLVHIETNHSD